MLIEVLRQECANISKCRIIVDFTVRESLLLAEVVAFCYVVNVRLHTNSIFVYSLLIFK